MSPSWVNVERQCVRHFAERAGELERETRRHRDLADRLQANLAAAEAAEARAMKDALRYRLTSERLADHRAELSAVMAGGWSG